MLGSKFQEIFYHPVRSLTSDKALSFVLRSLLSAGCQILSLFSDVFRHLGESTSEVCLRMELFHCVFFKYVLNVLVGVEEIPLSGTLQRSAFEGAWIVRLEDV